MDDLHLCQLWTPIPQERRGHVATLGTHVGVQAMTTYLTTSEAAAYLGLSVARVKALAAQGHGTKVGRDWLFTAEQIEAMNNRRRRGWLKGRHITAE